VVTWWTWTLPAVPIQHGQIGTSPRDGKQYRYDATANEWSPVPESDREVAPRDKPPPSTDEVLEANKHWAALNDEARRREILYASAVALVPPVLVLALGSALAWAFRGFR